MTREEIKESLPILKAFAEGKTIQYKIEGVIGWFDTDEIDFKSKKISYRIKPESEPKYRPFRTVNECWYEMQKHQPFGWVKYGESICNIQNITSDSITIIDYEEIYLLRFYESFMNLTFIDGSPFGIKEE